MTTDEFDPRRAEPDQEFTYIGTTRTALGAYEEVPEGGRLEVEQPDPGSDDEPKRFVVREGVPITLKADGDGVVRPRNAHEVAVLDSFALPVARSAKAATKAETSADKPKE